MLHELGHVFSYQAYGGAKCDQLIFLNPLALGESLYKLSTKSGGLLTVDYLLSYFPGTSIPPHDNPNTVPSVITAPSLCFSRVRTISAWRRPFHVFEINFFVGFPEESEKDFIQMLKNFGVAHQLDTRKIDLTPMDLPASTSPSPSSLWVFG